MKRSSSRMMAATDVPIDDNWVELNAPELALATSAPAIEAFSSSRASVHLGRFGAALSNVVKIPQANSSHAQTARQGTRTNSIFGGSNNRRVWIPERKESTKTLNAVAVASNVATAFVLSPDPSPPRQTRSNWLNILPEGPKAIVEEPNDCAGNSEASSLSDENRTATMGSETSLGFGSEGTDTPDTEIAPTPPACVRVGIPPIQIPVTNSFPGRRASSLPLPHEYIQSGFSDTGQTIMIEHGRPLFESPAPFTCDATASFSTQQREPSTGITAARSVLDGLNRLFEAVDRQDTISCTSTIPSTRYAWYRPYHSEFPVTPVDDRDWEMCNLTPATVTSSWHTADARERKLLIIGSGYDSENFRRATTETNATLAPLRGVSQDVKSLTSVFNKRSFVVETLVGDSFDAQVILNTVKNFLSDAIEGDVRAIVFTGHATHTQADGKIAIIPPTTGHRRSNLDEGLITADVWREAVNQSTQPGVIVLSIFASCLAGGMMDQTVNIRDFNDVMMMEGNAPSSEPSTPAPIFITFASSQFNQSAYESIVGPRRDSNSSYRYGDHFLRAFTLAARDPRSLDWAKFIQVLEEKFFHLRKIGAYCAAYDPDINNRDPHWLDHHPQVPGYSSSRPNPPAFEDVLPREISLFKREPPIPGLSNSVSITEEFLAHVSLCGENPEITHYTLPTPSNVVPPVVL